MNSGKYIENEKIMMAFLNNVRVTDIATETGLSRSTVARLKRDPDFQHALRVRRTEIVARAVAQMQQNLMGDVAVLESIIQDPDISPQIRLNGVQIILSQISNMIATENHMRNRDANLDPNNFDNQLRIF